MTIILHDENEMAEAGQVANYYAQQNAFADYISRKAPGTIRTQAADLVCFAQYLHASGVNGRISETDDLDAQLSAWGESLQTEPEAWAGVTYGLVDGFVQWMLRQGYATGTINKKLSTIKTYAKLAMRAGVLAASDHHLIKSVSGYAGKEAKRIDGQRETTRVGHKKASHVSISETQAARLKDQPDTPQGRRDALLMCLLLDHGLRVGEVALLEVNSFNLKHGTFTFYRPKVDQEQMHQLSVDTKRALVAWIDSGDCPPFGPVLRGSRKGGALTEAGMSERAITARVRDLGERIGLTGLSAHDCRHFWATYWAGKVDMFRLQEAGGWASLAMPRRYTEKAKVANKGMV